MEQRWKDAGYDPHKAWEQIKYNEWQRQNPGRWYDGLIVAGGAAALVGTLLCVGWFVLTAIGVP